MTIWCVAIPLALEGNGSLRASIRVAAGRVLHPRWHLKVLDGRVTDLIELGRHCCASPVHKSLWTRILTYAPSCHSPANGSTDVLHLTTSAQISLLVPW